MTHIFVVESGMDGQPRFRLATMADLGAIMRLIGHVVSFIQRDQNPQWDEHYPNFAAFERDVEKGQLWLAEIDGRIAGVVAITTDYEPEYAGLQWDIDEVAIVLHRLGVDTEFRGKGVAAALLSLSERLARQRSISRLRVVTGVDNLATQSLLTKLAYRRSGEIVLCFRPGCRYACFQKLLID